MKTALALLLLFLASSLFLPTASAERRAWSLQSGESVTGELIGVYTGTAYINAGRGRTYFLPFKSLDQESQAVATKWLESFAEARKQGPKPVSESDSKLTRFLAQNLVVPTDGDLKPYDFASQPEPDFYAFYYSAHWCGPCRRFTPRLREFYNGLRSLGYKDFEIIFVSSDRGEKSMLKYMEEAQMPWPAVKYNKSNHSLVSKYAGNGIPCLVVTDKHGNLLFHSYRGEDYLGPNVPKEQLNGLLLSLRASDSKL